MGSPPVYWCPASPWAAIGLSWPIPPSFCTGHSIPWPGISLWPGWILVLAKLSLWVPRAPSHRHSMANQRAETTELKPLSNNYNINVLPCYSILNPNYSMVRGARKRINSLPAEARPVCISIIYYIPFPHSLLLFLSSWPPGSCSRGKLCAMKNTWCFALGKKAVHQPGMEKEGVL